MSVVASQKYQKYEAPQRHGAALIVPDRSDLLNQLTRPSPVPDDHGIEFCGKPLSTVRDDARREVVRKALDYTQAYRSVSEHICNSPQLPPLILSGHQPELFHCGVWFKNFLLSALAEKTGAIAINFLVDNDLCRTTSIRVPALKNQQHLTNPTIGQATSELMFQSVSFDGPRAAIPWELRHLESSDTWRAFPQAVSDALLPNLPRPLLVDVWPDAVEAVQRSGRPGLAIAQMRHQLEKRVGLQTLEVPLSHLVSTRAFARFSIQLLSELPRLQEIYNSRLAHYRAAHRIRSHAHPVPALAQEHGWLEAPWWIYRAEAPQRRALWVRSVDNQLILSDRAGWQTTIEGRLDCDNAASQWLELQADGVCLRPRALLTTMYLRIIVSDLFIHGIGGGKYDQLTDGIALDFFGIKPSSMAVATATLHLPLGDKWPTETALEPVDLENQLANERDKLWQIRYHADQKAVLSTDEQKQLASRKHELLANIPPRGEKWRWHREMTAVNKRLSELAAAQADQARRELEHLTELQRDRRILQSRETSFCLFPLEPVTTQLKQLAAV